MIKKIYHEDAYLKKATATVQQVKEADGKIWITFDQTIFYPGGGGQLPDKGQINDRNLSDIREEDDLIWHGLDKKTMIKPGDTVSMQIDWTWRYYNMQQHSGQHLLSCVLDEFNLPTVSVHLGENYTTIEVDGEISGKQMLVDMELRANELLRKALPIHKHYVSREEAGRMPLRKPAGDWQNLRVVEIDKLDYSACGGTHVDHTAEIGYIKISGMEKIRSNTRIQAHIGQRADQLYSKLFSIENEIKQELQVEPEKYTDRIRNVKSELADAKSRMNTYRKEFIKSTAVQILEENGKNPRILFRRDDLPPEDIQEITKHLSAVLGKITLGLTEQRFYLMTPEGADFNTVNFLREKGPTLNMRGGGPAGFAQGVIKPADDEAIRQVLQLF